MSESNAFLSLDARIQRFLWSEQWEELRAVQEMAIPLVLSADRDVVIAAATATGKTEAAFLPALTHLLQQREPGLIVYVSPLKALINDQFARLQRLCDELDVPVWPWHGDVSANLKSRFLRQPAGVLLITPESLEATLCNRGTSVASIFRSTAYFVVDELHAFIGTERGKQLQSLLHRVETALDRRVPRIGLSATLGDMNLARTFLRSDGNAAIVEAGSGGATLKILVKGFIQVEPDLGEVGRSDDDLPAREIAKELFRTLRGSNNLVFPNSRREVERYTHLLVELSEQAQVPNEFWPHHGNLSREIRTDTEAALKQKERPATAICTSTLELGIDIGAVRSVAQIGTPPSVASLRQRLGRSGRRKGEPAILRGFVIEEGVVGKSSLASRLRLDSVQTAATISLLLENWFEPPTPHGLHLSTLVQQLLSLIAQYGGLTPAQAYRVLCGPSAPFEDLSVGDFATFLRHLGERELLMQDSTGVLLHGRLGDKFVNHHTFYAAFSADEEFRVVAGGKTLGTLPVDQVLIAGQRIVFAGRTWLVDSVDEEKKVINVTATKGGAPPLFNGSGGRVHTRVRQRMREIYESTNAVPFLDQAAQRFVEEGRSTYADLDLSSRWLLEEGNQGVLLTWLGDAANETLACLLLSRGLRAAPMRLGVEFQRGNKSFGEVTDILCDAANDDIPPLPILLAEARNLIRMKWDWVLPDELLRMSYASLNLNLGEARQWLLDRCSEN